MPDGPEKTQLPAIPRGLTLQPHDVDLLVAAGQTAITTSEPLRRFIADYPPAPPGVPPRKERGRRPARPGVPWHGFQNTNIDRQREGVAIKPASPRNWRPYRYQIGTEPVRLGVTMKQRPIDLHDTENVGRANAEEESAVSGLEHPQHLPRAR